MKKRESPFVYETIPTWQTVYCSLALILVVFFVMLVSYSITDPSKMSRLRGAVRAQGGITKVDTEVSLKGEAVGELKGSILGAANRLGITEGLEVTLLRNGIKLKVGSDIVFTSGSAQLSAQVFPLLDEIVKLVRGKGLYVKIEGHTDNIPINLPKFPSNWELSVARAMAVLRYFLVEGNIPPESLSAEGFAEFRPIASNLTEEGRAKNRRIEIYLLTERPKE